MARTFKQLQKEKSLSELNKFAKEVTERYATSIPEYSQTNASQDNNLTKKGLRDLMDYAIIIGVVSLEISSKVLEKAISNQKSKEQTAGGNSIDHHKKLMKQRVDFLAEGYLRNDIKRIAKDIAYNPSKTISYFTSKYGIESDKVIKKLLQRAIVENLVNDEIMEKIIDRSLKGTKNPKAKEYFELLKKKREEYKKENSH